LHGLEWAAWMSGQIPKDPKEKDWPHAPLHRLDTNGVFMTTAATLHKKHFFHTPEGLTLLENKLLSLAKEYRWRMEAWAVLANHYHFIACGEVGAVELDQMVKRLHSEAVPGYRTPNAPFNIIVARCY
jgi:REP-associated tyrosine transposase